MAETILTVGFFRERPALRDQIGAVILLSGDTQLAGQDYDRNDCAPASTGHRLFDGLGGALPRRGTTTHLPSSDPSVLAFWIIAPLPLFIEVEGECLVLHLAAIPVVTG